MEQIVFGPAGQVLFGGYESLLTFLGNVILVIFFGLGLGLSFTLLFQNILNPKEGK